MVKGCKILDAIIDVVATSQCAVGPSSANVCNGGWLQPLARRWLKFVNIRCDYRRCNVAVHCLADVGKRSREWLSITCVCQYDNVLDKYLIYFWKRPKDVGQNMFSTIKCFTYIVFVIAFVCYIDQSAACSIVSSFKFKNAGFVTETTPFLFLSFEW